MNKKDYVILGIIGIVLAVACILWFCLTGGKGQEAYIICNNNEIYQCKMTDFAVVVVDNGIAVNCKDVDEAVEYFDENETATNIVVISDGYAYVLKARCPDQICVNSKHINTVSESVVCMPNKVAVSIR